MTPLLNNLLHTDQRKVDANMATFINITQACENFKIIFMIAVDNFTPVKEVCIKQNAVADDI